MNQRGYGYGCNQIQGQFNQGFRNEDAYGYEGNGNAHNPLYFAQLSMEKKSSLEDLLETFITETKNRFV